MSPVVIWGDVWMWLAVLAICYGLTCAIAYLAAWLYRRVRYSHRQRIQAVRWHQAAELRRHLHAEAERLAPDSLWDQAQRSGRRRLGSTQTRFTALDNQPEHVIAARVTEVQRRQP